MMRTATHEDIDTAAIDPVAEDRFWRSNYAGRDYVEGGRPYSYYEPAYRYGWESRQRFAGRRWDDVESDLERGWERAKGESKLAWNNAKAAVMDAWHRVERNLPGDFDRDGR
jgi:hypothetical protein